MVTQNTWIGVNTLIEKYAGINSEDQVTICFTPDSIDAVSWVSACLRKKGVEARLVAMLPLTDPNFGERLAAALPSAVELKRRLVILTFERETMSHDAAIRKAICQYPKDMCAVFRSISSCEELFSYALHPTPDELSARNTALLERLMVAETIRIKANGGTDLEIKLDGTKHRWISNRGQWRPGSFVILPAGEVATYPDSIEGILVADFAFNVNALTERSARLVESPVTVEIQGGRAINHYCNDKPTLHFLDQCFETYCAHNVGELGLGTNYAVKNAISLNSHINERCPGVHLGFGQHNQGPGVSYQCNIHLDLIAKGGTIWIDDDLDPINLEDIKPSSLPHPTRTRDEDVFSPRIDDLEIDDCCGILTTEGLQLFNTQQPQ